MRKRRLLKYIVIAAALILLRQVLRLKQPEEIISSLCAADQLLFSSLNATLNCQCQDFRFEPCSQLDNLIVNYFSLGHDRHKSILYLTHVERNQRVVLKYRKNAGEVHNRPSFNGNPHFCGDSFHSWVHLAPGEGGVLQKSIIASMNFELALLQFLESSELPVPTYLGHCGLFLMQSYGGRSMSSYYKAPLRTRLTIARHLLRAALALTQGHLGFRIYLTDATGDNIAVDEHTLAVTFVDLDDVIIQHGEESEWGIHQHRRIECDNCFAYSTTDICNAPTSDINLYTICQLLLEDLRGRPEGGFLHGDTETDVHRLLRRCVYCDNNGQSCPDRFQLVKDIIQDIYRTIN